MNALTLVDRFTYVASSSGGTVYTPWVQFPSHYKNAELWVDAKTLEQGTITVTLQSSIDTSQEEDVTQSIVASEGNTVTAISTELGALVRLKITSTGAAAAGTMSVYLVPKQD